MTMINNTIDKTILAAANSAAQDVANEFSLSTIADNGDMSDVSYDIADTFINQLSHTFTEIENHENYEDFRNTLADHIFTDAANAVYYAFTPNPDPSGTNFAEEVARTIADNMLTFDMLPEDEN